MDGESVSAQLIDPDALIGVLVDIQIGIRKLSIYPATHPIIPKIISDITKHFATLFEFVESIRLGITKDEILYEGTSISQANTVIKELAKMLHQINLIGITFYKCLNEEDMFRFVKMVANARSPLQTEREKEIETFQKKVSSIALTFVSFKGAIQDAGTPGVLDRCEENEAKDVWKNLVSQLTRGPCDGEALEDLEDPDYTFDPAGVARVINHLMDRRGPEKEKAYEGVIIDYLQEHASQSMATHAQTLRMKQEIGKMFSNLRPDVREEIFRFSLKKIEGDHLAMEGLVENLPSAVLPEVLNQIQLSDETVSTPTFSLLKKLVSLSDSNTALYDQLEVKIQGHKDLFNELFLDKAKSTYYPDQYRALLDHELTSEQTRDGNPEEQIAPDEAETNEHLALILLDLLEGHFYAEDYFTTCINYMMRLLTEGIGERTQKTAIETIKILLKRKASDSETHRDYFQEQIIAFLKPEILTLLLKSPVENENESENDLLDLLFGIVGIAFIPILLDLLEVEEKLSIRKQIIRQIEKCGKSAIPLLIENLESDKWYVVRNMLVLLRTLQAEEALPQMVELMRHESARVRLAALQAIATVGVNADTLYQSFGKALEDDDLKVYKTAVSTLVPMNHPRAVKLLLSKLKSRNKGKGSQERRLYMVKKIGSAGGEEWVSALSTFRKGSWGYIWNWLFHRSLLKELETAVLKIGKREKSITASPAV